MRSWSSTRGRRPTTFAGTCSVRVPRPRRPWPKWTASRSGFALWFSTFSTFRGQPGLYLEDIFVKPSYRGRGIGKGLLAAVARRAVERGCGRLEWSVLDWNAPAIGFYRALRSAADGRVDRLPDRRRAAPPAGRDRARVVSILDLDSRGSVFDEPLRSTPHRADGRLRARRAAPGGRLHQAQHQ